MDIIILFDLFVLFLVAILILWRVDSNFSLIATPVIFLVLNCVFRVAPGFFFSRVIGVTDSYYPMMVYLLSFASLLVGIALGYAARNYRPTLPLSFRAKPLHCGNANYLIIAILLTSLFLVLGGLFLYDGIPPITDSITSLLSGEDLFDTALTAGEFRKEITKGHIFGGAYRGQGALRTLMSAGWPVVIVMVMAEFSIKRSKTLLLLLIVLLFLSLVFIAGDGTRAPFLYTFIIYVIAYSLLTRVRLRTTALILIILISATILLSVFTPKMAFEVEEEDFINSALTRLATRVMLGNSVYDVYAIDLVQSVRLEIRGGALHLRDLISALPGPSEGVPFAYELYHILNPGMTRTTYLTGTYLTKAYLDFDVVGVVAVFLALGFLTSLLQFKLYRIRKTPFTLPLISIATFELGMVVISGPQRMIAVITVTAFIYVLVFLLVAFLRFAREGTILRDAAAGAEKSDSLVSDH